MVLCEEVWDGMVCASAQHKRRVAGGGGDTAAFQLAMLSSKDLQEGVHNELGIFSD